MMKKYSKWILLVLCIFFVGMTPTFAREMTLEDFEEELEKISPDAAYVYVVGEYAFSSEHEFTRQDGMLAGLSIKVKDVDGKTNADPIYNEMTIYRYLRVEDDYGEFVGVEYERNMVGTTAHPETLEIKYIDYNYIGEVSNVEVKAADASAYAEIKQDLGVDFKNDDKITVASDKKNLSLSGVISPNDEIGTDVFLKEDLSGFYYAFVVEGLNDKSVVTVEGEKKRTYTKADYKNGRLVVLMALHPGLDVMGRNIKVTVDLDGSELAYSATDYTINYKNLVFEGATTTLLTEEDEVYAVPGVQQFLTNIKYDFSKVANLKLENGKLTGKILYNGEIGAEFSSRPEDITGYYFAYVLSVDGELTENSVITIPGNGGRKTISLSQFDLDNKIVIPMAIHPESDNKVITITVDLDGEGDKYADRIYTIDYSEVEFEPAPTPEPEETEESVNQLSLSAILKTNKPVEAIIKEDSEDEVEE